MANINVACIGECMVELTQGETPNSLNKNFAGDTYNTAYYLKYVLNDQASVSYVSAVGVDGLSEALVNRLAGTGLDVSNITRLEDGKVGLYLVENDSDGERHFVYWRETSAAKRMFDGEQGEQLLASLASYDLVYLSGISLAILSEEARSKLIQTLTDSPVEVVFDPNYRPKLWASAETASKAMQALVQATKATVLSTLDDETLLNGLTEQEQVVSFWQQHGASDVVVKQGADGCFIASEGLNVSSRAGIVPIDTTGAGDSFNGGYLAGLQQGLSRVESAKLGHLVASQVIQQRGAIVESINLD